tara:strand:- start:588 stop:833 length:246 start_codon:yes stop_codon:yes gene_type:complete
MTLTPLQNAWLTIFNFGPAIILGIYKAWWVGLIAVAATFAISWLITLTVSVNLPIEAMTAWAWLKPMLLGCGVLVVGWWLF